MAFGDSDMGVFFGDMGVVVSVGNDVTTGLLDANDLTDAQAFPGAPVRVVDAQTVVTIARGSLPSIVRDGQITVDGTVMRVRDMQQEKDGSLTYVYCVADK
ncbi:MAG TPA: hypothetical protein VN602_07605 [Gemmatimonadaceae bacterium]|nr:hypothetical protein [Gemmatimonadaceae bacterium]